MSLKDKEIDIAISKDFAKDIYDTIEDIGFIKSDVKKSVSDFRNILVGYDYKNENN